MKIVKRRVFSVLIVIVLILSVTSVVFATEHTFERTHVDSNMWTFITSPSKSTFSTTGDLRITNLYTADGSNSNYRYVYAKATDNGSSVLAQKGYTTEVPIPAGYQSVGSYVRLYLMGHDPRLDCKASGTWSVH